MRITIFFAAILAMSGSSFGNDILAKKSCATKAGALANPGVKAGISDQKIPIEHIIVVMQENHSFDEYFGKLNQAQFYGSAVDGITDTMSNPNIHGEPVYAHHENEICVKDIDHGWDAEHKEWDNGKNDQFVVLNEERAIGYFDETDLPYYYAVANNFAIADRYFCSVLSQTFPNRFFLMTGSAFGHTANDEPKSHDQFDQKTIFDLLNEYGITWKYYADDVFFLTLFGKTYQNNLNKIRKIADFDADLKSKNLPQVIFMDSSSKGEDEHPAANVQVGQAWVAQRISNLMQSSYWDNSVFFLTYDENGGFFDHVSPPSACKPDDIPPHLKRGSEPGAYDRYGFRVPFVAVSPYVKHHYVSHVTYDHTSILKFIETKYNLPALTQRDANADAMMDLFDFNNPDFGIPDLPAGAPDRSCSSTNPTSSSR